jgi:hypothetical protein
MSTLTVSLRILPLSPVSLAAPQRYSSNPTIDQIVALRGTFWIG